MALGLVPSHQVSLWVALSSAQTLSWHYLQSWWLPQAQILRNLSRRHGMKLMSSSLASQGHLNLTPSAHQPCHVMALCSAHPKEWLAAVPYPRHALSLFLVVPSSSRMTAVFSPAFWHCGILFGSSQMFSPENPASPGPVCVHVHGNCVCLYAAFSQGIVKAGMGWGAAVRVTSVSLAPSPRPRVEHGPSKHGLCAMDEWQRVEEK